MSDTRERSVVVCGEGLVDLVPVGENFSPKLGGGPFSVAIAVGRLGSDVGFVSRLSTDAFGDRMIDSLAASNVDTTGVERGPEPTTLAVVNLAADGGARYSFYLEGTADRQFALPKLPSARAFSFGTLSLVLEPGASAYEAMLHEAHARGRLTMVDPNIRPAVISDPEAYRRRFRSWLPAIDILKVSDDDAKWLGSVDGAEWLDEGVGAVLLTRGGDGLRLITKELDVSVPTPAVDVADTIGAGDTVHGALLAYLDRHDALDVAVVRGFSEADWSAALTLPHARQPSPCHDQGRIRRGQGSWACPSSTGDHRPTASAVRRTAYLCTMCDGVVYRHSDTHVDIPVQTLATRVSSSLGNGGLLGRPAGGGRSRRSNAVRSDRQHIVDPGHRIASGTGSSG